MRTVIYARYSSHAQNKLSTSQQIDLCRERADREGWPVVAVFADDAVRGRAGIGEDARPQFAAAMAMLETGKAEQLLCESTDRIARHQGDDFAVRERLDYAGARLFTLLEGEVDDITGTIKGLFNARFSKDLAARVARGQRSSIEQGRSPAGLAYGYRLANRLDGKGGIIRGLREIDPEESAIVLRIFTRFDKDDSPAAIALALNDERIPGPRGGKWLASTIRGDPKRQNGLLRNRLYAGELVHRRTSKRTDPRSRKARIRANAEDQWVRRQVPELRIVPDDLWIRVQAKLASYGGIRPEHHRRPRHLLSGKLICGVCRGTVIAMGRDQWGCGGRREGNGCTNTTRTLGRLLESRVLDGLTTQMLHPETVRVYVQEFHRDLARRSAELRRSRGRYERQQRDAGARVKRLVDALTDPRLDGIGEIAVALQTARAERDVAEAALAEIDAIERTVVALHPGIVEEYRRQAERLATALNDGEEARAEAMPIVQGMIERVLLTPKAEGRGVDIDVVGRLAAILAVATGSEPPPAMRGNGGAGSSDQPLPRFVVAAV